MKKQIFQVSLTFLFFINLHTQLIENKDKLLIGNWHFVKTVNRKEIDIKYLNTGYDTVESLEGPEIEINKDYTFIFNYNKNLIEKGTWQFLSKNKISFKKIVLNNTKESNDIRMSNVYSKNKWKINNNGNFEFTSTKKIIFINDKEIKIETNKKYFWVYKKIE